jgi:hypothetical protein
VTLLNASFAIPSFVVVYLGFGAHTGSTELHLLDYKNAEGVVYPNISKMPFIILKEDNSNKIAKLLIGAKEAGIQYSVFTDTMI